ncbi:unnamed protein product [Anisakis simplex]|uniref:Papilin n=1 Tax=Anisakis simplex TaxID=6269 RepID=A0A0M3KEP4_ANISI|nr:unnamed protein product [Anisakis simplex]
MDVEKGTCHLHLTKWYYNKDTGECHVFMYSGCKGNGNRFSSKAECEHLCHKETAVSQEDEENVCRIERDSGPCTDPVTQWYFDPDEHVCKQFTYGGCRGNGNRFDSREQCEKRCSPQSQDLVAIDSERVCMLPFEAGRCRESYRKWYFDKAVGYCRMFVYSGCDGNENRFDTEAECRQACSSLASRYAIENRASLKLVGSHVPIAGSKLKLICLAHNQHPIRWFKNGRDLEYEIANDHRIKKSEMDTHLTISDLLESDSGDYSCSAGWTGILSDPIKVVVKALQISEQCVDRGNQATCQLIIKAGLCINARYGKYCCRTCTESGFRV